MMTRKKVLGGLILFTFLILIAADSLAQTPGIRWRGSGGWGPGTPYSKLYDPKTVETISGEVQSVERFGPRKGMVYGVHATVKTDKETISV